MFFFLFKVRTNINVFHTFYKLSYLKLKSKVLIQISLIPSDCYKNTLNQQTSTFCKFKRFSSIKSVLYSAFLTRFTRKTFFFVLGEIQHPFKMLLIWLKRKKFLRTPGFNFLVVEKKI